MKIGLQFFAHAHLHLDVVVFKYLKYKRKQQQGEKCFAYQTANFGFFPQRYRYFPLKSRKSIAIFPLKSRKGIANGPFWGRKSSKAKKTVQHSRKTNPAKVSLLCRVMNTAKVSLFSLQIPQKYRYSLKWEKHALARAFQNSRYFPRKSIASTWKRKCSEIWEYTAKVSLFRCTRMPLIPVLLL